MDKQYREGSLIAKVAVISLLVLGLVLLFFIQALIEQSLVDIQLMVDAEPLLALLVTSRLLLWLVGSSGSVALVIGFYLCVQAARVARSGEYPPPGMPVVFRTEVVQGDRAMAKRRQYLWLAGLLFCQPLVGLGIWIAVTGGVW